MLEKLKESIAKLEFSEEFRKFQKQNPKAYLTSAFVMLENDDGNWQIDYYNPKTNKITAFLINERIKVKPESQVFQEDKKTLVKKLDLQKVKINFDAAMQIIENLNKTKYPQEKPIKKIIVLQNLPDYNYIWNITFLTTSFKTLNIKIDAETGKILTENLSSVISI